MTRLTPLYDIQPSKNQIIETKWTNRPFQWVLCDLYVKQLRSVVINGLSIQGCLIWTRSESHWPMSFWYQISVHFGLVSQNIMKSVLMNCQILSICQFDPLWGKIWNFFRSNFTMSQNVLKSDIKVSKSFRFVSFGANLTYYGPKSRHSLELFDIRFQYILAHCET